MLLDYHHETIEFEVPEDRLLRVLNAKKIETAKDEYECVKNAIDNPIGTPRLNELVKPGMKVAIVTSDITRPLPSNKILPLVIDELNNAKIPNSDIVVVFALGSHRSHTEEEKRYLVGEEVYSKVECVDSNPDDCVHLGKTKHGTDVDITARVANADFIICLGNIEYHYFAGYSGGAKAIMPGVSTPKAIQQNHSMMVMDEARQGNIKSPVRVDVEEAASMLGIDFIVNVVLDENKNIAYAVAGDYIEAHRVGCDYLDKMYGVKIHDKADIVVVSAGGFPKDQNLYQAQKALDNSKSAVKDGGIIILLASCSDGLGNKTFEEWMLNKTREQCIEDIKKNFVLGGHKAAAVAKILTTKRVFLVSSLDRELVRKMNLEPYDTLDEAFKDATDILGKESKVFVIPHGGSLLPIYKERRRKIVYPKEKPAEEVLTCPCCGQPITWGMPHRGLAKNVEDFKLDDIEKYLGK